MSDLTGAIAAFRGAVGVEHVLADGETLSAVERTTFATTQKIPALVRPGSREEVQECLRIARQFDVSLHPLSQGKNYGYGSRVPVRSGGVVLDLSRMARILEVDEDLAYAVVEPGVTFVQLHAHLEATGSRLFASVTGYGRGSVIGNALERGIGKGPHGDRFASASNFEVVLANGEVIETGFGRFPGAKANRVGRGVGPQLDGIFTQSSFGIVTRMTIWLSLRPEHFQTFAYRIHDRARLGLLVDCLRDLRLSAAIRTPFLLANEYRHLSFRTQYPWGTSGGRTPLSDDLLAELKRVHDCAAWAGDGALYSNTVEQARADRAYLERTLGPCVDDSEFWDEARAVRDEAERAKASPAEPLQGIDVARLAFRESMYRGIPIAANNAFSTYWRKKSPPPAEMDPDCDGCGFMSFSPAIPARGRDAVAAVAIAEEILTRHGFEPNLGLNFITERNIDVTGWLLYDRDVEGEDERATTCHRELLSKLGDAGYYAYRLDIESMQRLPSAPAYDALLTDLKRTVDRRASFRRAATTRPRLPRARRATDRRPPYHRAHGWGGLRSPPGTTPSCVSRSSRSITIHVSTMRPSFTRKVCTWSTNMCLFVASIGFANSSVAVCVPLEGRADDDEILIGRHRGDAHRDVGERLHELAHDGLQAARALRLGNGGVVHEIRGDILRNRLGVLLPPRLLEEPLHERLVRVGARRRRLR